jgi:Rad3-related DNA helicase
MGTSQPSEQPGHTSEQDIRDQAASYFPFDSYRVHQQEILYEAAEALYDTPDIDTVVIDAPTGIGKSAINMALGNVAEGKAFYTTPQKQLRNQLQNDDDLSSLHAALRARRDYVCDSVPSKFDSDDRTYTCDDCPINSSEGESCKDYGCAYWRAKEQAMEKTVATLTFAFLIVDGRMPPTTENGEQISFDKRETLIIDEAHTLAEQVASLHAGMVLSPRTLMTNDLDRYDQTAGSLSDVNDAALEYDVDPYEVFESEIERRLDEMEVNSIEAVTGVAPLRGVIESVKQAVENKTQALALIPQLSDTGSELLDELGSLYWKLNMVIEQLDAGEPWVISENRHDTMINVKLKPVYVGRFLKNNVWNRAEKVVLSTATMPYRNRPKKWLSRIGRDPDTAKIISKPMPFDAANRQVRADYQIGSMSSGGVVDNWGEILTTLRSIGDDHAGEKGIVHTVSYSRAEDVHNELPELTMVHESDSDRDAEAVIDRWQLSDKQMLLTPSMTEGVDLVGDKCRFQVLLKAPYRTLGDPRVNYLLNEEGDWEWYNDVTAREIIQSVGRAVRTPDDHATYYVLDSKFDQVLSGRTPEWFEDAIVR